MDTEPTFGKVGFYFPGIRLRDMPTWLRAEKMNWKLTRSSKCAQQHRTRPRAAPTPGPSTAGKAGPEKQWSSRALGAQGCSCDSASHGGPAVVSVPARLSTPAKPPGVGREPYPAWTLPLTQRTRRGHTFPSAKPEGPEPSRPETHTGLPPSHQTACLRVSLNNHSLVGKEV